MKRLSFYAGLLLLAYSLWTFFAWKTDKNREIENPMMLYALMAGGAGLTWYGA